MFLALLAGLVSTGASAIAADGGWQQIQLAENPGSWADSPLVHDATRNRMLAFDGNSNLWALDLAGMQWSRIPIPALGWVPIGATIFDPVGDRLLVFKRTHPSTVTEVWQLPLSSPGSGWSLVSTVGAPVHRTQTAAIYDPDRHQIVMFGGWALTGGWLNDAWTLDLASTPAAWSPLPQGPAARARSHAIYDAARQRMVLYGGEGSNYTPLSDVWALSLSGAVNWTPLALDGGPAARHSGSAVIDDAADRMIVFGGMTSQGRLDDTWQFSLATSSWTLLDSGSRPGGRDRFAAALDPVTRNLVVFGGHVTPTLYPASNDLWARPLSTGEDWVQIRTNQPAFSPRSGASLVWDPLRRRAVLYGGTAGGEVRVLGAEWPEWLLVAELNDRTDASAIWDTSRDRMVIFGGSSMSTLHRDVFTWSPQLGAIGAPVTPVQPSGRTHAAGAYDPVRDRALYFAGYPVYNARNQLWSLDLATLSWTLLAPAGTAPTQRYGHTMTYDPVRDRMIVFGGGDGTHTNELWALSLDGAGQWTKLIGPGAPPSARSFHSAIYEPIGDRLIVSGGAASFGTYYSDTWEYRFDGAGWRQLTLDGEPTAAESKAIHAPHLNRMLQFVSRNGAGILGETWALDLPGQTTDVPDVPAAAAFALHGATPNPAVGALRIAFTLPDGAPASLDVIDLAGRRVAAKDVSALGAGRHVVDLGAGGAIAPGLYFARLVRAGESRIAKICIAR